MLNRHPHIAQILFTAAIALLTSTNSIAQKLTQTQTTTIRNTITRYLGKEANLRVLENGKAAFLPIGKDTFYNIHGLRYVFQLKGDSAIRLDKSVYHGSNFYRYLFQYDGKMMSLGGYGQFVTNRNLEAFNPESHEWYLIQTKGDIPPSIKGSGLRFGDYVYVLNNCIDGNSVRETQVDDHFYRLDLKTMTWTAYREFREDHLLTDPHDFFYLQDYVIAKGLNYSFVYNLKTQEFIYHNNDALGLKQFNGYNTNINKNSLKIWVLDSAQTVVKDPQRDLDALWKEHQHLAKPLILNPSWLQQYPIETLVFTSLAICMSILGLWLLKRKKWQHNGSTQHPLVAKILDSTQESFTQEELDQLLGIAHMEGESKKTKRHRLLTVIDAQYPGLIERHKDSADKRRFLYFVHRNEE